MEESFSDFQEKKKCNTGPKNAQKSKAKLARRKPLKKSKTQKDIKVFLKGKENELVSYSKDFSEVCKKSRLDVDSEQLQLAIALSKSLQQSVSMSIDSHNSQEEKPLSAQERTAKIKLTLEEYGFKVPNTKIVTNKRRKYKKQYKLLLLSDEEKKQLITDKYLKILETESYKLLEGSNVENNYKPPDLYYIATNIPFENIRNDEIFYVKSLDLEISNNISLLRDWSEIPGRPLSPSVEVDTFKFKNIDYLPEELDVILSGSLKNIQTVIKNKTSEQTKEIEEAMGVEKIEISINDNIEVENITEKLNTSVNKNLKNLLNINELSIVPSVSVQRSLSPDIFDDDITILDQSTTNKNTEVTVDRKDNHTCFMDLTECVAVANTDLCKININICQDNNVSKRKSNDFMDITECVISSKPMCIEKIDLTQELILNKNNIKNITSNNDYVTEIMDITQSSNSDGESEKVDPKGNKSSDDTIIINDNITNSGNIELCEKSYASDDNIKNRNVNDILENSPLSKAESSETVHKVAEEAIPVDEKYYSPTYTYTDHVFDHSYIYDYNNFDDSQDIGNNSSSDESNHVTKKNTQDYLHKSDNSDAMFLKNIKSNEEALLVASDINKEKNDNHGKIDNLSTINDDALSRNFSKTHEDMHISVNEMHKKSEIFNPSKEYDQDKSKSESESVHSRSNNLLYNEDESTKEASQVSQLEDYNDYVFEHSYIYDYDSRSSFNDKNNENNENEIDLTQTSDVESMGNENKSNLGKMDNISVDYDDIIVVENLNSTNISKSSSIVYDKEASTCSKNSEVFEVSDKEFNYSLHQSRFDNYDADGFDDIRKESAKKSRVLNRSLSANDLNIRDNCTVTKTQQNSSDNTTPIKVLNKVASSEIIQTPSNDYIIKTHDVTPIADYASMSSPERNEELKRYGLKPFKRKRAIQLLTYLYNQTHPVVESCDFEEKASPAKRLKYDTPVQNSPKKSSKKSQSSKSPVKSTNLESNDVKENSLYVQTKDVPDIKEVHCEHEDWVFQTREKSKVHSCRVPLHIAFHNYVSCRRYLRESILRYEPINIDVIHKDLVSIGYRYNPKDLLKFMDKKCITVKTTDNNARNRR